MRKQILFALRLLTLILLLTTLSIGAFAKIEWVIASKFPATSMRGQYYQKFADAVEELSDGNFVCEIFGAEILGGTQAALDQLQAGTINMYVEGLDFLERYYSPFALSSFPFLFRNTNHLIKFFNSEMVTEWRKKLHDYNIDVIYYQPVEPYRTILSTKPIKSYEDFVGIKLRMFPNKQIIRIWEQLGANIIVTEWGEVYESLRTGLIEAVTGPLLPMYDMSFHEAAKYLLRTDEYPQSAAWMVYWPDYEKLSMENKQILEEAFKQAGEWVDKNYGKATDEALVDAIENYGLQFTRISMEEWHDKVWEFYPTLEEDGTLPKGTLDYIDSIK